MTYRFIRIKWANIDNMNKQILDAIQSDETVISMSAVDDEILILVRYL